MGWVAVGPRADYPRLVRSPIAKAVDDLPVWSLVCFVVPPARRGQGVARALLAGAIDHARAQGAVALEAYPIDKDPPGDATWLWNGPLSTYRKAGFVEVARRRPERPVVRRWFRGVDAGEDADAHGDDPRPSLLEGLHDEIAAWERLLAVASDGGDGGGTLRDALGHVAGWHEATRARLRAVAARTAPAFPAWLVGGTPRSEEALHEANARLQAEQRARPWTEVLAGWRAAHAETMERLAHVGVDDLTTVGRFEGLPEHALAAVVRSAVAHHAHHRAMLDRAPPSATRRGPAS